MNTASNFAAICLCCLGGNIILQITAVSSFCVTVQRRAEKTDFAGRNSVTYAQIMWYSKIQSRRKAHGTPNGGPWQKRGS